jgi:hypothetical protein
MRAFEAALMCGLGVSAIAYGLLNKQMRFRDGRAVKPGWQSGMARTWFIVLGATVLVLAFRRL